MEKNQVKKLVSFFYEIGNLRKITRAHQQTLLSQDLTDNIASHSFRTAFIGYFLAKELKADADKVIKMCLLHDIEEVRCGDQNWVHKRYVKIFEEEIRKGQLKNLPKSEELLKLSKEYQQRKTLEAKTAKDADLIDEIFLLREYELQGNKEATDWLKGSHKKGVSNGEGQQEKHLFTKLAKQIAKEAKRQKASSWWDNLWTPNRRK
jgi:putative hydrolase of HD superfamily